jgi:hypothetical protein
MYIYIYIYTTLKFLVLQVAPYIYDISRLRVKGVYSSIYEGISKIFWTGVAIYTVVVVAQSTGRWLGLPRIVSQCAKLHVAGWTWAVSIRVY